jgi:hypothetical protein
MPTSLGSAGIASFQTGDSYTPDQLLIGEQTTVTRTIILLSGQNLNRGALLGRITASGKHILSASAAGDGSQTPDCVLAHDCDATAGDKTTIAYFAGGMNQNALTLGAGHTIASITEGLRAKDIHLITAIPR